MFLSPHPPVGVADAICLDTTDDEDDLELLDDIICQDPMEDPASQNPACPASLATVSITGASRSDHVHTSSSAPKVQSEQPATSPAGPTRFKSQLLQPSRNVSFSLLSTDRLQRPTLPAEEASQPYDVSQKVRKLPIQTPVLPTPPTAKAGAFIHQQASSAECDVAGAVKICTATARPKAEVMHTFAQSATHAAVVTAERKARPTCDARAVTHSGFQPMTQTAGPAEGIPALLTPHTEAFAAQHQPSQQHTSEVPHTATTEHNAHRTAGHSLEDDGMCDAEESPQQTNTSLTHTLFPSPGSSLTPHTNRSAPASPVQSFKQGPLRVSSFQSMFSNNSQDLDMLQDFMDTDDAQVHEGSRGPPPCVEPTDDRSQQAPAAIDQVQDPYDLSSTHHMPWVCGWPKEAPAAGDTAQEGSNAGNRTSLQTRTASQQQELPVVSSRSFFLPPAATGNVATVINKASASILSVVAGCKFLFHARKQAANLASALPLPAATIVKLEQDLRTAEMPNLQPETHHTDSSPDTDAPALLRFTNLSKLAEDEPHVCTAGKDNSNNNSSSGSKQQEQELQPTRKELQQDISPRRGSPSNLNRELPHPRQSCPEELMPPSHPPSRDCIDRIRVELPDIGNSSSTEQGNMRRSVCDAMNIVLDWLQADSPASLAIHSTMFAWTDEQLAKFVDLYLPLQKSHRVRDKAMVRSIVKFYFKVDV